VTEMKQGVALTGRNHTGPPCSVSRPNAHAPGSITDNRRRQTPTRWKVFWESTTPRENFPNSAAYMGPFRHLGTSRSPIVGMINHHACDA